jgi:mycoredoxin
MADLAGSATPTSEVSLPLVLWRPGCGFCRILFAGLERHEIAHTRVNIWEDAAARRMLNDRIGSETVPTVLLGDAVMVNPSVTDLLERLGD